MCMKEMRIAKCSPTIVSLPGAPLNLARHRGRALCLSHGPIAFFPWISVSFTLCSLLTGYFAPCTISLPHPFSLTIKSSASCLQPACVHFGLLSLSPAFPVSAPITNCSVLFMVPNANSCKREADRPTISFLTLDLSMGFWATYRFSCESGRYSDEMHCGGWPEGQGQCSLRRFKRKK